MAVYKFLVSRTLTAEIEVEADDLDAAKAQCEEEVANMANSDFTDRYEQSYELLAAPTEEEAFDGVGIKIF